jgi:hypothetical protein
MRNRRLALSLVFAAFLLAAGPGCQALHLYRPVTVLAQDAETKKPIPGAEVRITYPLAQPSTAPWESVATTGGDGLARLRAAPYGEAGIMVDVTIPGYMTERKSFPVQAVEAVKPVSFLGSAREGPADFVVELYAEPFPGVELVLPDGYRGLVKVAVKIKDDAPCPPGQRLFSYQVPASGVVEVTGPPLLRRVYSPDFRARYAGGAPLNPHPQERDEVGFWSLKTEGGYDHYLVGARAEYEQYQRDERRESAAGNHSSGGKGRGRGKRNGGSSPSDSDSSSVSP